MTHDFEIGEDVWIRYHDGNVFEGVITRIFKADLQELAVTVLTPDRGYRTTKLSLCSRLKSDLVS